MECILYLHWRQGHPLPRPIWQMDVQTVFTFFLLQREFEED